MTRAYRVSPPADTRPPDKRAAARGGGLVLYAICDAKPARLGAGLRAVRAGGAWVVVGRGPPPEIGKKALRAFDRAVRLVASRAPATLPFRFATAVGDEASLRSLLDPAAEAIARALDLVRGCVQFTHRVYGEPARASKRGSSARSARGRGPGRGPGTRWLDARLARSRVPEIATVTAATAPCVRASRAERHDRPPLVASVYHLVPKRRARTYRALLGRAAAELSEVRVETSGPWPPYAFAELP